MSETMRIKSKAGHEAVIMAESWPAYEAQGHWTEVKAKKDDEPARVDSNIENAQSAEEQAKS